jgi:hypothetical protein
MMECIYTITIFLVALAALPLFEKSRRINQFLKVIFGEE